MGTGIKNFVDDYGGVGDNSTDNADAWDRAIAGISTVVGGVNYCRYSLYIPPGTYKTSRAFKAVGYKNLTVFGGGSVDPGAAGTATMTRIYNSAPMSAVMELDSASHACISDLYIEGSSTTANVPTYVLHLHHNPENSVLGSTRNKFSNLLISGKWTTAGVCVGTNGEYYDQWQNDQTFWYSCYVLGSWNTGEATYWQRGWQFGTGVYANCLQHFVYGCGSLGSKYGVYIAATGPVSIYGGNIQNNDWDFYTGNQNGPVYVQGIRSENSKSGMLYHSTAQSVSMPVELNGCEFHGNLASTNVGSTGYPVPFWIEAGGPVRLINCRVRSYPVAGTKPRIYVPETKSPTIKIEGLTMQNTRRSELFITDNSNAVSPRATVECYVGADDSSSIKERRQGPALWNPKDNVNTGDKFPASGIETSSIRVNKLKKTGTAQAPDTPTLAVQGTAGSTSRSYKIVYKDGRGNKSLPSATATTTTSNATLTTTNRVKISPSYNAYDFEAATVDVLRDDAGTWRALYKSLPVTEFYQGVYDDGRADEDGAAYTLPTYDALGDVYVDGCIELLEMSDAPTTPAANRARLYARDNGAGKTELVVKYPSGAVSVLDTEP